MKKPDGLFSKILGCEFAGAIGNAMGDKVESRTYQYVEEKYGLLDRFVEGHEEGSRKLNDFTYDQYRFEHRRAPAATEDGFERHKLCAHAIIRAGGHIGPEELTESFVRYIDNTKFGYLLGWQDQFVFYSGRLMKDRRSLGEFASWPGRIGTSKMIMPVGMINAGNPERAYREGCACARIKDAPGLSGNYAVETAGVICAAVAEALKPDATVDSVIATVLSFASDELRGYCGRMLDLARSVKHWRDIREPYAQLYKDIQESMSHEILPAGLAAFYLSKGDPREAIVIASNMGRDTDCKAYVAGGLAGALRGVGALPAEWIEAVEAEVAANDMTVLRQSSYERAEGLYRIVLKDRGFAQVDSDSGLDGAVRRKLGLKPEAPLFAAHYESLRALDAGKAGLKNLSGVEKLKNLEWLKLDGNAIADLSPLASLEKLVSLDLGENRVRDLRPLAALRGLKSLFLCSNEIVDASPLAALSGLEFLHLSDNRVRDLSFLSGMSGLKGLFLDGNRIEDLKPLSPLGELLALGIGGNWITDLAPLKGCAKLIALYADDNRISDAGPLAALAGTLKTLGMARNGIRSAAGLDSLKRLIQLDLSGNPLDDLSFIGRLSCLGALSLDGVGGLPKALPASLKYLSAAGNGIRDAAPVLGPEKLFHLDLSDNLISDAAPFAALKSLKRIKLKGNPACGKDALGSLPLLEEIDS